MGIFEKKNEQSTSEMKEVQAEDTVIKIDRPKMCMLDMDKEAEYLKTKGYNIYNGSLGSIVNVPNSRRDDSHYCLINYDYPDNLHEYDIIVVDQSNSKTVEYIAEDHKRNSTKGNEEVYLLSKYPQTKFDPRPLSGALMSSAINDLRKRGGLIIVFGEAFEEVEYEKVIIDSKYRKRQGSNKYSNYNYLGWIPHSSNKTGTQFKIQPFNDSLQNIIEKYSKELVYHTIFNHPEVRNKDYSYKPDPNFVPLIKNNNEEIISFIRHKDNLIQIVFPQFKDKKEFLKELLSSFLPDIQPSLFPYSTRFNWTEREEYWLPNHGELLKSKEALEEEYDKKLKEADKKLITNQEHFGFLHDLLTETGDSLVDAVEKFFHFLEFDDIKNMDDENPEVKEEDLQVALSEGILVIEVKGIGGVPKDIDCNQISKIKYRRAKERNAFDVNALTIINHQRYIPPTERVNTPFSKEQIGDAENDERGLLSTWQLFNLYYEITGGIITKEDARRIILDYGLIKFKPSNIELIGMPNEIHYNGKVVIIDLSNQELKTGDEFFIYQNERYIKSKILSMKKDENTVDFASDGEVGIKINNKIKSGGELWKIK